MNRPIATAATLGCVLVCTPLAAQPSVDQPKTIIIRVDNDSNIFVDDQKMNLEQLESYLKNRSSNKQVDGVRLFGDTDLNYKQVAKVLDIVRDNGLAKVGLVTGKAN